MAVFTFLNTALIKHYRNYNVGFNNTTLNIEQCLIKNISLVVLVSFSFITYTHKIYPTILINNSQYK